MNASTTGYGRYVGRVGALAVALGVGMAVATAGGIGVARADDDPGTNEHAAKGDTTPSPGGSAPTSGGVAGSQTPPATHVGSGPNVSGDDPSEAGSGGPNTSLRRANKSVGVADPSTRGDDAEPGGDPVSETDDEGIDSDSAGSAGEEAEAGIEASASHDAPLSAAANSVPASSISRSRDALPAKAPAIPEGGVAVAPSTPATTSSVPDAAAIDVRVLAVAASEKVSSATAVTPTTKVANTATAAPDAFTAFATNLVAVLLSPFATPGPSTPTQAPLLWAILAFVRREVERSVEQLAAANPQTTAQTVGQIPTARALVAAPAVSASAVSVAPAAAAAPPPTLLGAVVTTVGNVVGGILGAIGGLFNSPPVSNTDVYSTPEDTALNVPVASGVLKNDTDANGNTPTAQLVSGPARGTLVLNANGSFTYTPTANYAGTDSFTYRAFDGTAYGNTATVNLTVTPVNDAPTAVNDAFGTSEDTAVTLTAAQLVGNDTDPDVGDTRSVASVGGAVNGAVALNANGTVTFTPTANFNGPASFTYQVKDAAGAVSANSATVSIAVAAVNDAPTAVNDAFGTNEDTAVTLTAAQLVGNDTDPEGDVRSVTSVGGAVNGAVNLNADGSVTFTPTANFNGPASFTYQVKDAAGAVSANTATVSVAVAAVNDAPTAVNDAFGTNEDTAVTLTAAQLVVNDTDPDVGDTRSVASVGGAVNGAVALNANGTVTFTPTANFNGPASFTYQVKDAAGAVSTNSATVSIAVAPIENAPPDNTIAGTINVGIRPSAIAASPDGRYVWVTSALDHAIKVVDTNDNSIASTITVSAPGAIYFAPDGLRAYVLNGGASDAQILVINTTDYSVAQTLTVPNAPNASSPPITTRLAISPDGQRLYTNTIYQGTGVANPYVVNVLDAQSGALITSYPGLVNTTNLVPSRDGQRLYVAGNVVGASGQFIRVYDTTSGSVLHTIPLPASNPNSFGPTSISVSPDGSVLLVGFHYNATANGPATVSLLVYDTSTMALAQTVPIDAPTAFSRISDIEFTPSGDRVYIAATGGGLVLDATDFSTIATISGLGGAASGDWTIRPDGKYLYAAQTNTGSGSNLIRVVSIHPPSNVV